MKKFNFLLVALLLTLLVMQASAQTFTFNSATGVITGLDPANPNPTTVTIPDEISAVKVRGIGIDAFNGKTSITSLVFNTTVLDSIGMGSFRGCTGLTSITIPASVTKLGFWAFQNCSGINQINFNTPSTLASIGQGTFEGLTSLTSIVIPNSVTSILPYAFYNSSALTTVSLSNSITKIPDGAFRNCTNLSNINFPDNLNSIGDYAFENCKLASASFPTALKTIGVFAFKANALSNINLNSVTSIGAVAFQYCNSLTAITIPNTVSFLGDYAFDGCANLSNVTFSQGSIITSIGQHVFSGIKINAVSIPNSVTNLDKWSFGFCSQLANVTLLNSLLTIQQGAFEGSALTSVIIPASVISIGDYAFYNSASLAQVRVLKGSLPLTAIGNGSFQSTSSSLSILVPAAVVNDYKTLWTDYASKIVADTTTSLNDNFDDKILVSQNTTTNYLTIKRAMGANVQIVNMVGQSITQIKNLSDNVEINTADWRSGCYIVIIDKGAIHKCIKIIK